MQQKTSPESFISDIQSTMKQLIDNVPGYPLDIKTMMETQRKNIQALTEVNQRTMQNWQALAQRQSEMVSQMFQSNSGFAGRAFSEGTPQEKIAQQTDLLKKAYENTIQNSQEITEMLTKCTKETADVINKRVVASLNEIKSSAKDSDK